MIALGFKIVKFPEVKILTPLDFFYTKFFFDPQFMYFGQIRPEMIEIKVFRKIKILTPLNLGGQNFLLDWIARVKVPPPPVPNLVSPALRVSELEGITLKNGNVP